MRSGRILVLGCCRAIAGCGPIKPGFSNLFFVNRVFLECLITPVALLLMRKCEEDREGSSLIHHRLVWSVQADSHRVARETIKPIDETPLLPYVIRTLEPGYYWSVWSRNNTEECLVRYCRLSLCSLNRGRVWIVVEGLSVCSRVPVA